MCFIMIIMILLIFLLVKPGAGLTCRCAAEKQHHIILAATGTAMLKAVASPADQFFMDCCFAQAAARKAGCCT